MADCGLGAARHTASASASTACMFHDAIESAQGAHLECMQSFGERTDHTIIRNSKFTNCAQWDISGNFG